MQIKQRLRDVAGKLLVASGLTVGVSACSAGVETDGGGEIDSPAAGSERASLQAEIDAVLQDSPDGTQISEHEIAWHDGAVVLDLSGANADTPQDKGKWHGCPSGWFCFYQHNNWGGRRLQFSDCSRGGVTQYLTDYGFQNQTTSWVVNRNLNFLNVNDWDYTPQWPDGRNLWNGRANSASSNVGADANDKADWFICYL